MYIQVIRALTWNDSPSSLRGTALALPALRGALAAGRVGAGEANGALTAVLQALRLHGQHDANQAALLALAVQVHTTNLISECYTIGSKFREDRHV